MSSKTFQIACLIISCSFLWLSSNAYSSELHRAISNGTTVEALKLIEQGVDVNSLDERGLTPLGFAIVRKNATIVQRLLAVGADIDFGGSMGFPPVSLAVMTKNAEMTRILVQAGADINRLSRDRNTALDLALLFGVAENIETIQAAGGYTAENLPRSDMGISELKARLNGKPILLEIRDVWETDWQGTRESVASLYPVEQRLQALFDALGIVVQSEGSDAPIRLVVEVHGVAFGGTYSFVENSFAEKPDNPAGLQSLRVGFQGPSYRDALLTGEARLVFEDRNITKRFAGRKSPEESQILSVDEQRAAPKDAPFDEIISGPGSLVGAVLESIGEAHDLQTFANSGVVTKEVDQVFRR